VLGVVALLLTGGPDDAEDGEPATGKRIRAEVVEVTDGDTIRVRIGSAEESVRYIGIDTPESVAPGRDVECFGPDASERNSQLVAGRRVTLEPGAERRDRYGRLLAYVHTDETFVNAALVRAGFARTLEIAPNTRFAALFGRLEQRAANAGRGLWGAC